MPRVDWRRTIPPALPWTDEDVRIFLALPIHLQAASIHADGVDAKLMLYAEQYFGSLGYRSVAHMMLVRMFHAR